MSSRAPRSTREHLIFKALCVLDDAIDSCSPIPVKPNVGLRLALALLFVFSDGDRQMFDEFWRTVIADDRALIRISSRSTSTPIAPSGPFRLPAILYLRS